MMNRQEGRLEGWSPAERWLLIGAAVTVSALIPVLIAGQIDDRMLNGINIWIKPAKFLVSTALHLATLAVLLRLLETGWRMAWPTTALGIGAVIATAYENAYIILQAARGRHSHYNSDTAWEAAAYSIMGVGAVYLIGVAGILGAVILIRSRTNIGPGLKHGAAWGLMIGFVATFVIGGYLGGAPTGYVVDGERIDAHGLPIVGWSTQSGDLRVAHFFGLHMMQALPILGWLADRVRIAPKTTVGIGIVVGMTAVIGTFVQALNGQPFL